MGIKVDGFLIFLIIAYFFHVYKKISKKKEKEVRYGSAIYSSGKGHENRKENTTEISKKPIKPILKGYQIYIHNTSLQGIQYRRNDVNNFIEDDELNLKFQLEPENQHDKNAIKIIGLGKYGEYVLGYVDKEDAKKIAVTNVYPYIYPRLIRVYRSKSGYIDVVYQIIGEKEKKEQFDSFEKNLPINKYQIAYLKFWEINYEKNITTSIASSLIDEHKKIAMKNTPEKWDEWELNEYLEDAYENFSYSEGREQFDIYKPTKKQLKTTLDALIKEGKKLEDLDDSYETLIEKLTDLYPQVQK